MKWFWNRCHRRQDASLLAAGALSEEERIEMERHLASCEECRDYYSEVKALTAPLAGWEKRLSTIEATPVAQRRWAGAVQEAAEASSSLNPNPQRLRLGTGFWRIVWVELLWPSRYAWSGLAALWVAMLVINAQLSDHQTSGAGDRAASSQDMIQAWEEQNRVLAELAKPSFTAFAVPAPPPYVPRPRSERKQVAHDRILLAEGLQEVRSSGTV
jgi:anti-sigma factor RsiW